MSEHELWNELGNLYFMSGAYDQAVRAYCRSIQLEAGFGRPYSNLALTYVQQGKYDQAIDLYRKSIELLLDDKEKAISWNRMGNVYRHLKDYQQAVIAFQRADELDPESQEGREEPGQVVYPDRQPSQAREDSEVISWALKPEEQSTDPQAGPVVQDTPVQIEPETLNSSWTPVETTQYQGDLSEVPEAPPPSTWTDETLQEDLEELSGLDQEAEVFVLDTDQGQSDGWLPLPAQTPDELNVEVMAEVQEQNAPVADANRNAHYPEAGPSKFASLISGREDSPITAARSESDYQPVEVDVEDQPEVPTFLVAEGHDQPQETSQAEVELEGEAQPAEPQPGRMSEAELKDIELDIAKFKRVVQVNPRNAIAWDTLGTLYKSAGLYRDAILAYQQAIAIDSNKPYYHHHLGLVYAAEGRDEDAINAFQKVIDLDPDYSLAHATLGGYYRKMGLDELAQQHIGKAMRVIYDSENEYNRACLEAICGNVDQAIELLRIALKNKQTYVDWVLRDPDLDFIRNDPRFKQLIADYAR